MTPSSFVTVRRPALRALAAAALAAGAAAAGPGALGAQQQDTTPRGVSIGLNYAAGT
jgi:hypothetical protein